MSYQQDYQFAQSVLPYYGTNNLVSNNAGGSSSGGSSGDDGNMSAGVASRAAMLSALGAQTTYGLGRQNLANMMSERKKTLKSNYNNSLTKLKSDYDLSSNNINDTASNGLKQAYINNMMSQKNLKQKLASQGITGGATESTLGRLLNAYGNNRNNITTQRDKDLSSLENVYTTNKSNALQNYNNALAQLEQDNYNQLAQLQNAYYDRLNQAISDYANSGAATEDALNGAIANYAGMYGYYGTPTSMFMAR